MKRSKNSGSNVATPCGPEAQPIARPPTSRMMLLPKKISCSNLPQRVFDLDRFAIRMPTMIAGTSSSTRNNGICESYVTLRSSRNAIPTANVATLTEP